MEYFEPFYEVVNTPYDYARQWKTKNGRKVCGYFCSYGPEELIWAAGVLPFRILGSSASISAADAHLQAYCCRLVRGGLEDALSGNLDFLDGAVFPHTCDSIQRLSDVWRLNTEFGFHADFVLPVKLDTPSAREYMVAVFRKLKRDLEEELGVAITKQDLDHAIRLFNQIRRRMHDLYRIKSESPDVINGKDLHTVVKASMMMDRTDFLTKLTELGQALENRMAKPERSVKRLILSGGLCNMPDVYQTIEKAGGVVVGDDLCTGARFFQGQMQTQEDPLKSIADRYVKRVVCPAKHSGVRARGENLVKLVKENEADGVVFVMLKFCDPHAFDYPYLRDMLMAESIPSTLFEIEDQHGGAGQFRTRCEAFIEML